MQANRPIGPVPGPALADARHLVVGALVRACVRNTEGPGMRDPPGPRALVFAVLGYCRTT